MNVSDEAVEAAAMIFANEADPYGGWDGQMDEFNDPARESARRILEAAAPYLLAGAWDEGMEAMYESTSHEWPPIPEANPYRRAERRSRMTGNWEREPVDRKRMPQYQGCANPDVGPRCPACRMGLVTHEPKDPRCIGHSNPSGDTFFSTRVGT